MAEKAVFGIAQTESQAVMIADNLKAAGFTANDVSGVCLQINKVRKTLPTSSILKRPKGRLLALAAALSWAEHWAGLWVSARWQYQVLDPHRGRSRHGGPGWGGRWRGDLGVSREH